MGGMLNFSISLSESKCLLIIYSYYFTILQNEHHKTSNWLKTLSIFLKETSPICRNFNIFFNNESRWSCPCPLASKTDILSTTSQLSSTIINAYLHQTVLYCPYNKQVVYNTWIFEWIEAPFEIYRLRVDDGQFRCWAWA